MSEIKTDSEQIGLLEAIRLILGGNKQQFMQKILIYEGIPEAVRQTS